MVAPIEKQVQDVSQHYAENRWQMKCLLNGQHSMLGPQSTENAISCFAGKGLTGDAGNAFWRVTW